MATLKSADAAVKQTILGADRSIMETSSFLVRPRIQREDLTRNCFEPFL